ncbi:MAG: peroxidase-related enzyme [Bacteroidales bacterium]
MTTKKISRYSVPAVNETPEDIQHILNGAKANLGFIPNVLSALSHHPDELRAFMAYDNAVMHREGSNLTDAEKQLLIVAFSAKNGCIYCVQSHGAQYRIHSGDIRKNEQVTVNHLEADITDREKAIIDFAMKVSLNSAAINEDDFSVLRLHGLNDEDIWDIASITAFYNMSNRMMSFLKVYPDKEWDTIGRK